MILRRADSVQKLGLFRDLAHPLIVLVLVPRPISVYKKLVSAILVWVFEREVVWSELLEFIKQ